MTKGFDQQDRSATYSFTKSAPTPQHGQRTGREAEKLKEPRSFQPRPAH